MKRSAGLLLWRWAGDGLEVLLAHPGGPLFAKKDEGSWTIPKGEIDPGEDEWTAAQREFSEELGIAVPAGTPVPLGEANQANRKVNVIWALEADPGPFELHSNLFEMQWPPRSGVLAQFPEIDRVAWTPLETAKTKIFASQRPFLERLADLAPREARSSD